jgi:deoxyribodipyrimidine photo-lyase
MSPAVGISWWVFLSGSGIINRPFKPDGPESRALSTALVWFRRDLRLADNPALATALARHAQVIPVFVHAPEEEAPWPPGAAQRVWLQHSLAALDGALRTLGSRLLLRHGPSLAALRRLVAETEASAVYWNRLYEPAITARDRDIKQALRTDGLEAESFNAALLAEPWTLQTRQAGPYRVYTPFARALRQTAIEAPQPAPRRLPAVSGKLLSEPLESLALLPRVRWDRALIAHWQPCEDGAGQALRRFLKQGLAGYREGRNLPGEPFVSRLSPHLHFGEIGPRQLWQAVQSQAAGAPEAGLAAGAETFLNELIWREFAHHLLYHFPHTPEQPLDARFARFPWADNDGALAAWQRGRSGIPIVDAGMRELWQTGWMHNRVRMIVASFLTKNLLLPWQHGARWFWDTLLDADLASNTLGWQWTAGCGADAAPYFRIFNPVLQGARFDPLGRYVRRWVPELSRLPDRWIHQPWAAPGAERAVAGIELGVDYPLPLADLAETRERALAAYATLRELAPGR